MNNGDQPQPFQNKTKQNKTNKQTNKKKREIYLKSYK